MMYQAFENYTALTAPWRTGATAALHYLNLIPAGVSDKLLRRLGAALELISRSSLSYARPAYDIKPVMVGNRECAVTEDIAYATPFGSLLHFKKDGGPPQPRVLLVAPMSGHYATLLRGTVEGFLPGHDVYITDWADARMVPLSAGRFDLEDYVDYVIEMLHALGGNVHVVAVCQPSVPVLVAASVMEANKDPLVPHSMTLMGGPIDTRSNPTAVNKLAEERGMDWFRSNVITKVPFPHPGFMRDVYPGFLQLNGFISMNLDRHVDAHKNLFANLVKGDGDLVDKHVQFYDEYLAVMDLTAEFYLQTVDQVFVRHLLPKGEMKHRGKAVDPSKVERIALMTVEGEHDDISGLGQTEATHRLCSSIPMDRRVHYVQKGVGHYGVFNGSRFRSEILPRISDFMVSSAHGKVSAAPTAAAAE